MLGSSPNWMGSDRRKRSDCWRHSKGEGGNGLRVIIKVLRQNNRSDELGKSV